MALSASIRRHSLVTLFLVAVPAALAGTIALRADQAPQGGGAARPLVPMTASTIARDPVAHMGENVSMMASVEAILSKTIFTVDQDKTKSTGHEVIVIAPTLTTAPDKDMYVTVQGEVMKFDPAEIARRARNYTIDLPADLVEKYRGKPAVLATAIVTPALVDLAKRPIPPPSPTDLQLSGSMKTINASFTSVRGGLDKPDAAQLKDQIAALKKAFTDVESVFKARGTTTAANWAGEALKHVTTMEQGVAAAKWDDVKAGASSLQPLCAQCHNEHRERMDDGTYRLKGGGQ